LELLKTTGLANKVATQRTPPVWRLAKVPWAARSDLRTASLATKTTGHAWMDALAISRRAAEELFERVMPMQDNAGVTAEHCALGRKMGVASKLRKF
jgi:hypothetical protein